MRTSKNQEFLMCKRSKSFSKIILLFVILLFSISYVNAPDDAVAPGEDPGMNACSFQGGRCYYDHELNNLQCPNNLRRIGGEDGERLCDNLEGHDVGEGVNCCVPREDDNGGGNVEEGVTLLSVRNAGTVRVGVNGEEPCCVAEGYAPDEGEVCCQGMPTDGEYGGCGCPSDMDWIITPEGSSCQPRFFRCGWDPNEEDPRERNKCTTLSYILVHPIECLFGGPESEPEGSLPYEQVCCPYLEYEGETYYRPEDVVVY